MRMQCVVKDGTGGCGCNMARNIEGEVATANDDENNGKTFFYFFILVAGWLLLQSIIKGIMISSSDFYCVHPHVCMCVLTA